MLKILVPTRLLHAVIAELFLLSASPVLAKISVYSGIVQTESAGKYFLYNKAHATRYEIDSLYISTKEQLARLKTNDFISVQAEPGLTDGTLLIYSINFVGLADLLGLWKSDEDNCYFFDSFSTLKVYASSSRGTCAMPYSKNVRSRMRSFNYFINPGATNWYLIISDQFTNMAAELIILNPEKTIQLRLFDDITGEVLSLMTLRR